MEKEKINIEKVIELFHKSEYLQGNYQGKHYEISIGNHKGINYSMDEREYYSKIMNSINLGEEIETSLKIIFHDDSQEEDFSHLSNSEDTYYFNEYPQIINIFPPHIVDLYNQSFFNLTFGIEQIKLNEISEILFKNPNFKETLKEFKENHNLYNDSNAPKIVAFDNKGNKIDKTIEEILENHINNLFTDDTYKIISNLENSISIYKNIVVEEDAIMDVTLYNQGMTKEEIDKTYNSKLDAVTDFYMNTFQRLICIKSEDLDEAKKTVNKSFSLKEKVILN